MRLYQADKLRHNKRLQNKVLRAIINAPWYVINSTLHRDLKIGSIVDESWRYKAMQRLQVHLSTEIHRMKNNGPQICRLKRNKPDLVY